MPDAGLELRYQTYRTRRDIAIWAVGSVGALVWGLLSHSLLGEVVMWTLAVFFGLMAWRATSAGFYVDDNRALVKLYGYFFTRTFEWSQVAGFEVRRLRQFPYAAHIVLCDGRTFSSVALVSSEADLLSGRANVQSIVDALNRVLGARRAGYSRPG